MSRVGSGDGFDIGLWAQGDNPGAGSQDFTVLTDTGLNGNFKRLWRASSTQHNNDGTHKNDVITGANIVAAAADGSTLEASAATGAKAFRIKDVGVTTAKLADASVTTAKLADANVTSSKLAANAVVTAAITDANVTTAKLADRAVTGVKMAHDDASRKSFFAFIMKSNVAGTYAWYGDQQLTANFALVMPRAGSVTRMSTKLSSASAASVFSLAYSSSAGTHFAAGDTIAVSIETVSGLRIRINGALNGALYDDSFVAGTTGSTPWLVTLEVEFDD